MAVVRFDPLRDLAVLQDRMNRLFDEAYGSRREDQLMNRGDWMPPVDIYEDNGALVLNAELPGMRREDIDVTVENNTLTLRGERKMEAGVKQENIHRLERTYGSFARSFSLPNSVDPTQISAEYKNGVLTLRLPYREEARPRTISINVA